MDAPWTSIARVHYLGVGLYGTPVFSELPTCPDYISGNLRNRSSLLRAFYCSGHD